VREASRPDVSVDHMHAFMPENGAYAVQLFPPGQVL
jgi:hypothetical protein